MPTLISKTGATLSDQNQHRDELASCGTRFQDVNLVKITRGDTATRQKLQKSQTC